MRNRTRNQGRFVARFGLRQEPGMAGSLYELIIKTEAGVLVSHATEYYRLRKEPGPNGTPRTYLSVVLPFLGFQLAHGYAWDAHPDEVRHQVLEFLKEDLFCIAPPDPDIEGYWIEPSGSTPISQQTLGVFFAGLADFYEVMIRAGYYGYANPMISQQLIKAKHEHIRRIANAGAPDEAGIRGEPWNATNIYPTRYFRIGHRHVWHPEFTTQPEDIIRAIQRAIQYMIDHAPTLRDELILRLLRITAARLHEVIALTAGGYRAAPHPREAKVRTKGSHGQERKTILFSDLIEEKIAWYIRHDRAECDPQERIRLEDLDDSDAIFLSRAGKQYSKEAFYYHWYRAFQSLPTEYTTPFSSFGKAQANHIFSPHDIRHLFVTEYLVRLRHTVSDSDERARRRESLCIYMGWRDRRTLGCYDHSLNVREAQNDIFVFQNAIERPITLDELPHIPISSTDLLSLKEDLKEDLRLIDEEDLAFWKKYQ